MCSAIKHPRRSSLKRVAVHVTTSAAATTGDVQGDMLPPSAANKQWVRLLASTVVVALAAKSAEYLPNTGILFLHVLLFGTFFGSVVWTSTIAGITMFRNLPRQTFGRLQSKLFPMYFGLCSICTAILMATLKYAAGAAPAREFQLLGIALASSLANLLFIEPRATNVMFERYELENAAGPRQDDAIKKLYKQFGKWHGMSSMLNLVVLVCAVGHAFYLGGHIIL